jgi:hypothetical protein
MGLSHHHLLKSRCIGQGGLHQCKHPVDKNSEEPFHLMALPINQLPEHTINKSLPNRIKTIIFSPSASRPKNF